MNVGDSDIYKTGFGQSVNTFHFIRSLLYSPLAFEAGLFKYMSLPKSAKLCILGEASREFGMPLLKNSAFEIISYLSVSVRREGVILLKVSH